MKKLTVLLLIALLLSVVGTANARTHEHDWVEIARKEPTCQQSGYIGYQCSICGSIERKEILEQLPHNWEPIEDLEPTCQHPGYKNAKRCTSCGEIEKGIILDQLPHQLQEETDNYIAPTCWENGYTGDHLCAVCQQMIFGEVSERLSHDYDENNVCKACEWRVPGLYINDAFAMSWDDLVSNGYVEVSGDALRSVGRTLKGLLVISEDIHVIGRAGISTYYSIMNADKEHFGPDAYYIPANVSILTSAFRSSGMSDIRFFGPLESMGSNVFDACKNLKTIKLPDVKKFDSECFSGNPYIESIEFSESLLDTCTKLNLAGCNSLKYINEWPRNIAAVDLSGIGMEELTLPSSISYVTFNEVQPSTRWETLIRKMDLSQTSLTEVSRHTFLGEYFKKLEVLLLPKLLKALYFEFPSLKLLNMPDGLNDLTIDTFSIQPELTTIVWPASLIYVKYPYDVVNLPNVEIVYYRGNEFQWELCEGKKILPPNVKVVFNTTDEMVEELVQADLAAYEASKSKQ